jgi:hypothetical protein
VNSATKVASHICGLPIFNSTFKTDIGRYKLLEKIGEGGMGVVYMAEQEEPVRRKVALKIPRRGTGAPEHAPEKETCDCCCHATRFQSGPLTPFLSPGGGGEGQGLRRTGEGAVRN